MEGTNRNAWDGENHRDFDNFLGGGVTVGQPIALAKQQGQEGQ